MPYGSPSSNPIGARYVITIQDSSDPDLWVTLEFVSHSTTPDEGDNDDFMQRVLDALHAGSGIDVTDSAKIYDTTQSMTPSV